jgi:hypothetical protein
MEMEPFTAEPLLLCVDTCCAAAVMSRLSSRQGRMGGGVTNRRQATGEKLAASRPNTAQGSWRSSHDGMVRSPAAALAQIDGKRESAPNRTSRPPTGASTAKSVPKLNLGSIPAPDTLKKMRSRQSSFFRCVHSKASEHLHERARSSESHLLGAK